MRIDVHGLKIRSEINHSLVSVGADWAHNVFQCIAGDQNTKLVAYLLKVSAFVSSSLV